MLCVSPSFTRRRRACRGLHDTRRCRRSLGDARQRPTVAMVGIRNYCAGGSVVVNESARGTRHARQQSVAVTNVRRKLLELS